MKKYREIAQENKTFGLNSKEWDIFKIYMYMQKKNLDYFFLGIYLGNK